MAELTDQAPPLGGLLPLSQLQSIAGGIPAPGPVPTLPAASAPQPNPDPTIAALEAAARGQAPPKVDPYAPTGRPMLAPVPQQGQAGPVAPPRPMGPVGPRGPSAGEKYLSAMEESDKRKQAALGPVADAAQAASSAEEDLGYGVQASHANAISRLGELDDMQKAHMARAVQSMQQTDKEISDKLAAMPEIKFDRRGTGEKVVDAIAMALGAFGAAMPHTGSGGRNFAAEIINKKLDGDVDSQKANIEKQWKILSKQHDIAKDDFTRQQWMSEQMDRRKLELFKTTEMMIDGYKAQATSKEAQVKLADLSANVVGKREDLEQKMLTGRYNYQQALAAAAAAAANSGGMTPAQQKIYQAYQGKFRDDESQGKLAVGPDGKPIPMLTPQQFFATGQGSVYSKPGSATPGAAADEIAKLGGDVKSTSLFSNPVGFVSQHFQGTEGHQAALNRDTANAAFIGMVKKLGGPRDAEKNPAYSRLFIGSNDTDATIKEKSAAQARVLRAQAAAGGKGPAPAEAEE